MRAGIGDQKCTCCFEESCFGCALTAPPVGMCPVCGKDVRLDDFYEWQGDEPVHWECLEGLGNEQ